MALETVSLDVKDCDLPRPAQELLRRLDERERDFRRHWLQQPPGGFFASDYHRAYATLRTLRQSRLTRGPLLCEWGSGSGGVTLLGGLLGFQAVGIEIQEPLVAIAAELAEEVRGVEFACGSFVPREAEEALADVTESCFLTNSGADGYELLGLDPTEVDTVYCFPWPNEEELVERLFDLTAGPGALLITYRGDEELVVQRKLED